MGLVTGAFFYSLLCGIVPCDFINKQPESTINPEYYLQPLQNNNIGEKPILKNPYPVVEINDGGFIRGYSMGSMQGKQIHSFEGIRYGETTSGQNRFKPPIPAKPQKMQHAFKPGPLCLQTHPLFIFRVVGSEDCLFLNIYTANLKETLNNSTSTNELLPVIVFIHGGTFFFGEGAEYGPAYLVDQNVLLVTINYRLSVMGFLSTGDEASTGNYGLKDQGLALKWIHENIKSFGGDPEKVTIMGQSAGAVSVHLHLLSNKTREYFRSGISISGSGFLYWGLQPNNLVRKKAIKLARIVGCPHKDSETMVYCFRQMNPHFLVGYTLHLFKYLITPLANFGPVIEPKSDEAFISDSPEELYAQDKVAKYPLISTMTSQEGYLAMYFVKIFRQMTNFRRNLDKYLPIVFEYEDLVDNPDLITLQIRNFYFGSLSPETVPLDLIADMATDRFFTNGVVKSLKSHAKVAPTYGYLFNYFGRFNFGKLLGYWEDEWGIGHIEDIFYIFNSTRYYEGFQRNYPEYHLTRVLTNMIANFATKGKPLYTDKNGNDIEIWNQVEPNKEVEFLLIEKQMKMIQNPFIERIKFWESLGLSDIPKQ